ncbi:fatty-acyl-CoA synthase [Fulvimarina manganoxydans]|uniref:Fatty-acyl-CoA synthase n=1 Tax=Fulvimarina manganoxydans TaxID=937218 RepID=A0A1W2E9B4_9HYPH|nr:acyl-CoA synthetase [Fulvimarina manganoxydans]SMD06344.1 fatty-acyl-CoA synthase [Fulvimarina manganoxydans]
MLKTRHDTGGVQVNNETDIAELEEISLAERGLPTSTYEMLSIGLAASPESPALSFFLRAKDYKKPVTWTQRELLADITRTANALRRLGIGRSDVVAFVLPNLPETHFVIWGGEAAGIAFAINPLLEAEQIGELLRAGRAKWLVTLEPTLRSDIWEKASQAAAQVPDLAGILTVGVGPYVRGAAGLAFRTLSRFRRLSIPGKPLPILNLRREIARENGEGLNFETPGPDDISSYFCTGGTTGTPKIAKRTHFSEVFNSWSMRLFAGEVLGAAKPIFCGLPLFHVNGQLVTGLAPWSNSSHVILGTPQGYRGEGVIRSFWDIVEHYRIFAFSGVPTVYSSLLQVPLGGRDISSVGYGFCGAAPMPVETFRNFEKTTGIRILEAYGLTEGACVSSVNPPLGERRIGSIGIRIPYQKMAVVRLDNDGRFAGFADREEVGLLAIHGPNVFAGYVIAEHNEGIWLTIDGERWLNTGDLARQDVDGYFWLTGRKKELIIRSGHNIDPQVIEQAAYEHPAVQLAAAVGRPDVHAGELPVLYVQLRPDHTASEKELLAHVTTHIPERAAQPRAVIVLPDMPVTPVGKIFKPALSMREIELVVRTEANACGVTLKDLSVVQDSKRGLLAKVRTEGDATPLREKLGQYVFQTDVL